MEVSEKIGKKRASFATALSHVSLTPRASAFVLDPQKLLDSRSFVAASCEATAAVLCAILAWSSSIICKPKNAREHNVPSLSLRVSSMALHATVAFRSLLLTSLASACGSLIDSRLPHPMILADVLERLCLIVLLHSVAHRRLSQRLLVSAGVLIFLADTCLSAMLVRHIRSNSRWASYVEYNVPLMQAVLVSSTAGRICLYLVEGVFALSLYFAIVHSRSATRVPRVAAAPAAKAAPALAATEEVRSSTTSSHVNSSGCSLRARPLLLAIAAAVPGAAWLSQHIAATEADDPVRTMQILSPCVSDFCSNVFTTPSYHAQVTLIAYLTCAGSSLGALPSACAAVRCARRTAGSRADLGILAA
jgi:hypothetical protein